MPTWLKKFIEGTQRDTALLEEVNARAAVTARLRLLAELVDAYEASLEEVDEEEAAA